MPSHLFDVDKIVAAMAEAALGFLDGDRSDHGSRRFLAQYSYGESQRDRPGFRARTRSGIVIDV